MDWTLVVSALAASVASGLFLAAGLNVRGRGADAGGKRAVELFSLWWVGLATYASAGASQDMIAAFGVDVLLPFLVLRYVQVGAVCIGLWGLMYYVAYLMTGRRGLLAPLALFYGAYYGILLFVVTRGLPTGVEVRPWGSSLVFADPLLGPLGVASLLVVPPLVAALTYLVLFVWASEQMQRLRVVMVAAATLAWSGGTMLREFDAALLPAALGLMAGWTVSWAYVPPAWLRERMEKRVLAEI